MHDWKTIKLNVIYLYTKNKIIQQMTLKVLVILMIIICDDYIDDYSIQFIHF